VETPFLIAGLLLFVVASTLGVSRVVRIRGWPSRSFVSIALAFALAGAGGYAWFASEVLSGATTRGLAPADLVHAGFAGWGAWVCCLVLGTTSLVTTWMLPLTEGLLSAFGLA